MTDSGSKTRITFRYLSEPDMIRAGVNDMKGCIDAMENAFELLGVGDYRLAGLNNNSHGAWLMFPDESPFPGMPIDAPERRFMAMPAYLGGKYGVAGMKWYGSNIENKKRGLPRSILTFILNDADTGAPKAMMSANLLSATRTGAVPGLGARYFANPQSRVLGIVGPGVMNKTSLAAFMVECPEIDTIKITGRSEQSINSFVNLIKERYPSVGTIQIVEDVEHAVRGSDIVSVAITTSAAGGSEHYPLIKREWVKPGAYLSMPGDLSIDDGLYANDVLKVVDTIVQHEAYAEMFPSPLHEHYGVIGNYFMDLVEAGKMRPDDIHEMGTIVAENSGRLWNENRIVLFSIGGIPVEDVAWGAEIYENALQNDIGTELLLWDTPALS